MKHIITAIIAVICIVLGGFGGHFLKSSSGGGESHASSSHDEGGYDDGHGDSSHGGDDGHGSASKSSGHGASSSGGEYGNTGPSGNVSYFRFSREFVVPVLKDDRVASLVILNLNLEVDSGASSHLFSIEPKLRDNIMATLIGLSSEGDTFDHITDVESYETVRSMVLMNLRKAVPNGIHNVLITDMAKQDL
ncbi:MAG: flagellar basal body-associated FliL family protein [Hyphomonadaceae bacterium]|nr:flagellar basal body-associated FliL family protein [Hyphomonadaceae bacterium]